MLSSILAALMGIGGSGYCVTVAALALDSGSSVSLPHSASSLILINCLVGKPEGVALSCRVNIQVSVAAVCL